MACGMDALRIGRDAGERGRWCISAPRPLVVLAGPEPRSLRGAVPDASILTGVSSARIAELSRTCRPIASAGGSGRAVLLPTRPASSGRGRCRRARRSGTVGQARDDRRTCRRAYARAGMAPAGHARWAVTAAATARRSRSPGSEARAHDWVHDDAAVRRANRPPDRLLSRLTEFHLLGDVLADPTQSTAAGGAIVAGGAQHDPGARHVVGDRPTLRRVLRRLLDVGQPAPGNHRSHRQLARHRLGPCMDGPLASACPAGGVRSVASMHTALHEGHDHRLRPPTHLDVRCVAPEAHVRCVAPEADLSCLAPEAHLRCDVVDHRGRASPPAARPS